MKQLNNNFLFYNYFWYGHYISREIFTAESLRLKFITKKTTLIGLNKDRI